MRLSCSQENLITLTTGEQLPSLWTGKWHLVYFPSGYTQGVLVWSVAAPQSLDERGGRLPATDHVFLTLLLLNFQRKTRAQYTLFITYTYIDYVWRSSTQLLTMVLTFM